VGPADAPVTIVEFFDPACEPCRAFYPLVKQIMAAFPKDVRLVLRYAAFHPGSDEAVRILETARLQGRFEPVLEAMLARQAEWASHHAPNIDQAWKIAGDAGLDLPRARSDAALPAITQAIERDMADVRTHGVRQTPTFFVNGRPLLEFGPQQLYELVQTEVRAAQDARTRG
jgi:protein-disulfide isomerase